MSTKHRDGVPKSDKMDGTEDSAIPRASFLTAMSVTSGMCRLRSRQENAVLSTWRLGGPGVGRNQSASGGWRCWAEISVYIVFLHLGLETDTEGPGLCRTGAQVVLGSWSTEDRTRCQGSVWVGWRKLFKLL